MAYNLYGCGAFFAALALGGIARLSVPDEVMTEAAQVPLTPGMNALMLVYALTFLCWIWIYFRTPRSAGLALFGAILTALAGVPMTIEVFNGNLAALPVAVIAVTFSLLVLGHWWWLRRARTAPTDAAGM
jgi:predicted Na+-dependent transporter